MTNILETASVSHDFDGLAVLQDVNLEIRRGERHAIIGPNGAGKTTLFNIITGSYRPKSGRVYFKGCDITGARPHQLARLGIGRSFQVTSTFARLTTFENLRLAVLSKRGIRFNLFNNVDQIEGVAQETDQTLVHVNLKEQRDVRAGLLSYGKGRALEVSLAMATDAELVLLDEPTAGMSRDATHRTVELIERLTEGKTAVIVEHDMDVVFTLADRITVLDRGSIIASGTVDEIRKNALVKDAYLGH